MKDLTIELASNTQAQCYHSTFGEILRSAQDDNSHNAAAGSSDIEGKAAMGSGERAGKGASFNGAAEGNSGIGRGGSPNRLDQLDLGDNRGD